MVKEKIVENLLSKKVWSLLIGIGALVLNAIFQWDLSEKSLEMIGYMVVGLCAGDGLAKLGSEKLKKLVEKKEVIQEDAKKPE